MIRIWFILAFSSIRLSVEEWKVRNMSGTNATLHVGRLIIKFVFQEDGQRAKRC
jgi:hypothetical protein